MSGSQISYGDDFVAVHPDDSASRGCSESCSRTRSLAVVEPPAANIVDFSAITDPAVAKAALAYAADYYSAYRDYCKTMQPECDESRPASPVPEPVQDFVAKRPASVGSGVSHGSRSRGARSPSSVGSGVSRLSARSIRSAGRAAAWKEKQIPDVLPPGLCYARLLRPYAAESVVTALGYWPTIRQILDQPAEAFLPLFATEHFVFTESEEGLHVDAGCDGVSLNSVFLKNSRRSVCNNKFGSYGHSIARSRVPSGTHPRLQEIDCDYRVGGGPKVYGYPSDAGLVRNKPKLESSICNTLDAKEHSFCEFEAVRGVKSVACVMEKVDLDLPTALRDPRFARLDMQRGTAVSIRTGVIGDGVLLSLLLPPEATVVSGKVKLVGRRDYRCVFVCPASFAVNVTVPYDCEERCIPMMHSSADWLLRSGYCFGLSDAVSRVSDTGISTGKFCFVCRVFHDKSYKCDGLSRAAGVGFL